MASTSGEVAEKLRADGKLSPIYAVSYAFCKRFPEELTDEIYEHILNKALNNRVVDPSLVIIDGTHIKASANKKKFQNPRSQPDTHFRSRYFSI